MMTDTSCRKIGVVLILLSLASLRPSLAAIPQGDVESMPPDAPLTEDQAKLLDLAMGAASRMPHDPHIKNRSRAQQAVVMACLEMDQPRRAARYVEKIDNWRRGVAAAECALYLIRNEQTENVDRYLRIADAYAELADQDWRRVHIKLRVTEAKMLMGDPNAAGDFRRRNTEDAYRGKTESTHATLMENEDYDVLMERLDQLVGKQLYEPLLNASETYLVLYQRHYEDADKRRELEQKLRESHRNMGGAEVLSMLMALAEAAIENGDHAEALRFIGEADAIVAQANWPSHREYEYVFRAQLAGLRYRAGDAEQARAQVDAIADEFRVNGEKIINIRRAEALVPIAETYQMMGLSDQAREIYEQSIKESRVNPNGRPRAIDLSEICTSMALHGVKPDDTLWTLLHKAYEDLGPPW